MTTLERPYVQKNVIIIIINLNNLKIASYSFKNIYICTPSQRFYLGSLDASFSYVCFSSKFDSVEFGFTPSLPDDKVLYRVLVLALWLDGRPKEQE